jgi:tetratricopeptide (TPR) repeat protein
VPRKPGETVDAWRNRIAALEARYEYSKAALERGDFASAASGFEAILRSEPGFGDAPDLLVQARAGLRTTAAQLVAAGRRLDTAGDWVGALQQYERAREVDANAPGLDAAMKHVREQLRAAGREALERGLEQERLGHQAEALQEFTKALQWLPTDDANIPVARAHADRLRLLKKE